MPFKFVAVHHSCTEVYMLHKLPEFRQDYTDWLHFKLTSYFY